MCDKMAKNVNTRLWPREEKNPFQSFIKKKKKKFASFHDLFERFNRMVCACWQLSNRQQACNLFDQCQFKLKILAFVSVKILVGCVVLAISISNNNTYNFSRQAFLINQVNYTIWPLDAVHLSVHDFSLPQLIFRSVHFLSWPVCLCLYCVDSSQFSVKRVDRVVCWKLQQCINEFFLFSFAQLHGTMFIFRIFYTSLFMHWMMVVVWMNVCVCVFVWVLSMYALVMFDCAVFDVAFFLRSFSNRLPL